ncbi:MAG TPA: flavin reductase family protein [Steroidobacteraceae bacterium]|nr:flavin reductase family protein [Steroidobacteraceae bacterium]
MTKAAHPAHFSARELREVFGTFATGVTVVTAVRADGEPVGTTANSFTSVSLDPPLILWCLSVKSKSISAFSPGAPFAVHVLAHDQRDLAVHFARSGRERFDVDAYWRENPRPPHIAGVLSRMECGVHSSFLAGDHWIIVGEVRGLETRAAEPLAFHAGRFGRFTVEPDTSGIGAWQTLHGEWF